MGCGAHTHGAKPGILQVTALVKFYDETQLLNGGGVDHPGRSKEAVVAFNNATTFHSTSASCEEHEHEICESVAQRRTHVTRHSATSNADAEVAEIETVLARECHCEIVTDSPTIRSITEHMAIERQLADTHNLWSEVSLKARVICGIKSRTCSGATGRDILATVSGCNMLDKERVLVDLGLDRLKVGTRIGLEGVRPAIDCSCLLVQYSRSVISLTLNERSTLGSPSRQSEICCLPFSKNLLTTPKRISRLAKPAANRIVGTQRKRFEIAYNVPPDKTPKST
jgi:hypothetical protein